MSLREEEPERLVGRMRHFSGLKEMCEEGAVIYEQGVRVFVNGDRVYVDEEEDHR